MQALVQLVEQALPEHADHVGQVHAHGAAFAHRAGRAVGLGILLVVAEGELFDQLHVVPPRLLEGEVRVDREGAGEGVGAALGIVAEGEQLHAAARKLRRRRAQHRHALHVHAVERAQVLEELIRRQAGRGELGGDGDLLVPGDARLRVVDEFRRDHVFSYPRREPVRRHLLMRAGLLLHHDDLAPDTENRLFAQPPADIGEETVRAVALAGHAHEQRQQGRRRLAALPAGTPAARPARRLYPRAALRSGESVGGVDLIVGVGRWGVSLLVARSIIAHGLV